MLSNFEYLLFDQQSLWELKPCEKWVHSYNFTKLSLKSLWDPLSIISMFYGNLVLKWKFVSNHIVICLALWYFSIICVMRKILECYKTSTFCFADVNPWKYNPFFCNLLCITVLSWRFFPPEYNIGTLVIIQVRPGFIQHCTHTM